MSAVIDNPSPLTFDAATHTYRLYGSELPSVTTVLRPLYEGAFAGVKDEVLERKRALGEAVHKACELDDRHELNFDTLSDELRPYLEAWRRFRREHDAAVVLNERRGYCRLVGYAGTVDRVMLIDGSIWLIDLKTTAEINRAVGVQLAGYAGLTLEGFEDDINHYGALRLLDNGTYRLKDFTKTIVDDGRCFRALLSLHNWRKNNGLGN